MNKLLLNEILSYYEDGLEFNGYSIILWDIIRVKIINNIKITNIEDIEELNLLIHDTTIFKDFNYNLWYSLNS